MPGTLNPKKLPEKETDLDFSDLIEKYTVPFDDNLDNLIVVDGLPKVDDSKKEKLLKVVQKIFNQFGKIIPESLHLPQEEADGKSMTTGEQASTAVKSANLFAFDKKHTLLVNKFSDIEYYNNLPSEFVEPEIEAYTEREHLLSHLADPLARDQFVTLIGDTTSINWNNRSDAPESLFSRKWSPQGTYLTSLHRQGIALWGGSSWNKIIRFVHPGVKYIDYSPNERYLVSWSNEPIVPGSGAAPGAVSPFSEENEGHQVCVWDIKTGVLLRSFPHVVSKNAEQATKFSWPIFKWSPSEKYFARVAPGQMLSIYTAPDMGLLDKKSIKVDGIVDFEWAPAPKGHKEKKGEAGKPVKKPDDMIAYWVPEIGNNPARVTLISVPSKEILRTKNLFNVNDCKFYWHQFGNILAVRVNRFTKSKKSTFSNLEMFRVREKDIPVEVIELKENILQFAWENAKLERFAIITTGDALPTGPSAPESAPPTVRTNVSFYVREISKSIKKQTVKDQFKHVATLEKKTVNHLTWSPKGRHLAMVTFRSQSFFGIEFLDMDFDSDSKNPAPAPVTLGTAEHFGVTDLEWDPTGRYVISSSSSWRHNIDNGFNVWDFKGTSIYKKPVDLFKQLLWRPRPKSLLSEDAKKKVKQNLSQYSEIFDDEDASSRNAVSAAELAHRKRLVDEWNAWRIKVEKDLQEERVKFYGVVEAKQVEDEEEIEEWVEEVVEELEEIVQDE